jgi:hypothetical protein
MTLPSPPPAAAATTSPARRNALLLLAAMLVPVVLLRLALHASPDQDFDVAGHNVHHLYTGLVLVTLGGIPLALFPGHGRWRDAAVACFGIGLGMALDEWVYLIATDGSNASYLLPVSVWGAVVVLGMASVYAAALAVLAGRRR